MSVVDAHSLRGALADAMDVVVLNDDAVKALAAPILQRILNLRDHGVPEPAVAELLDDLKACCLFNKAVTGKAKDVCGHLDELARAAHHCAGDPDAEVNPLTVRAIVRALRDPLKVLADPGAHDGIAYGVASDAVRSVIAQVPAHKLLSNSVRVQLGGTRHDLLAALIRDDTVSELAA